MQCPPKNPDIRSLITVKPGPGYFPRSLLMYLLFESWTVGSCRFQIHLCVDSCMRNEPWIHTRFSYEILPAQFPWIWCKCLLRHLIHSKIFNLTKCREVLSKYSLLIRHTGMPNLTRVTGTTNGFFFQIINSVIESFWGKLDLPWLLTVDFVCFVCLLFYLQWLFLY